MLFKNFLRLASLLCILTFIVGCTSNASEKIDGRWVLDVQKTRDYTPPSEEEKSLLEQSKDLVERGVQNIMEDTELTFNTKDKTVSGKLFGVSISNKQYGIVNDSSENCTIVVINSKLTITPKGNSLTLQKENGDLYYFNKAQ